MQLLNRFIGLVKSKIQAKIAMKSVPHVPNDATDSATCIFGVRKMTAACQSTCSNSNYFPDLLCFY